MSKEVIIEDVVPQCFNCKHFIETGEYICNAFPEGVPEEILYNRYIHTEPYEGDNGIQFEEA